MSRIELGSAASDQQDKRSDDLAWIKSGATFMVDMAEAIERRRGNGPQVVRVERAVVNEGGQAIVGTVLPGAASQRGGGGRRRR